MHEWCHHLPLMISQAAHCAADKMDALAGTRCALDLHMQALLDGKERTANQWQKLFQQAGFRMTKQYPTRSLFIATEAVVA